MEVATVNQQPFRLLDLPAELRRCVYDSIEFRTTWHVLDRTQALLSKRYWPVPPKTQVYESRVTLIRPHAPLEILMTCHLVRKEASPILKRKMEDCRLQPVRYLVDYSAAWALVGPSSPLRSCLGVADRGLRKTENRAVGDFVQMCGSFLSQTRWTQNGVRGPRVIEMTITRKSETAYGIEFLQTMAWLGMFKYYGPTKLVFIYKSPLPSTQLVANGDIKDSKDLEKHMLQTLPREWEIGNETSSERGVFMRPLEGEAFEKHVEGLASY
ncbi:hypothetical protein BCR34DRAFT_473657 [Clohesyomyces aquaticus]|uniref:F-box domain-containing protein n=1 Tax=Clohesyomyces aquaticus TaxID=1231657 RepID=A0A1Y2A6W9_9PLEO|nr:hypothetical protein BCR34DRAFT_473657 [Clohesyomyces aquaticus]